MNFHTATVISDKNHPSGNLDSSDADIKLTSSLKAFCLIDDCVLGHKIVCNDNISMADKDLT